MRSVPQAFADDIKGITPPKFSAQLATPQRYYLWAYEQGSFEDKVYKSGPSLPPGAKVHVIDQASGDFLPLNTWMNQGKEWMGEKAWLIGSFETIQEGQMVEVISNGLTTPTLIGISSKGLSTMIHVFLAVLTIFVLTVFLAISTLVMLIHRRKKQLIQAVP